MPVPSEGIWWGRLALVMISYYGVLCLSSWKHHIGHHHCIPLQPLYRHFLARLYESYPQKLQRYLSSQRRHTDHSRLCPLPPLYRLFLARLYACHQQKSQRYLSSQKYRIGGLYCHQLPPLYHRFLTRLYGFHQLRLQRYLTNLKRYIDHSGVHQLQPLCHHFLTRLYRMTLPKASHTDQYFVKPVDKVDLHFHNRPSRSVFLLLFHNLLC